MLRSWRQAAAAVKLDPQVLASESGPAIAQRLRSARVAAIRAARRPHTA